MDKYKTLIGLLLLCGMVQMAGAQPITYAITALVNHEDTSAATGVPYTITIEYANGTAVTAAITGAVGDTLPGGFTQAFAFPAGTAQAVIDASTVSVVASTTVTVSGYQYAESITYSCTIGTDCTVGLGNVIDAGTLAMAQQSGTCVDGLFNCQDSVCEDLTDCGGPCGACLSADETVAMSATLSESSQDVTGTLDISSLASVSGGTPSILVTLAMGSGTLVNTENASQTLTITPNASTVVVTKGSTKTVLLTVTVPGNRSGTYTGTVNTTNNASLAATQTAVTLTIAETSGVVRPIKRMEAGAAGVSGAPVCLGEPVVITVTDENRGTPIKNANVDVYFGPEESVKYKVAYGDTDENGQYEFTPTEAGDYLVTVTATRYRKYDLIVSVASCGPETTTMPATTTTVYKPPVIETTTTVTYTTSSTVRETTSTTVSPVTTTVYKQPVTTVPAPPTPPAKKGTSTTLILLILIVILVGVALYMKSKGGGGAPPAEQAPAAGEAK